MLRPVLVGLSAVGLAAGLSGCMHLSPFAVDTKADPAVQKAQAEAKAEIDKAIVGRLEHCDIRGSIALGVTNLDTTLGLTCLPKPWEKSEIDATFSATVGAAAVPDATPPGVP
jgi:predicted membrane-bound mannosyltransferase